MSRWFDVYQGPLREVSPDKLVHVVITCKLICLSRTERRPACGWLDVLVVIGCAYFVVQSQ